MGFVGLFAQPEISLAEERKIGPSPHYHHSAVNSGALFCHFGLRTVVRLYPVARIVREGGEIGELLVVPNFLQAYNAGLDVFYHCKIGIFPSGPGQNAGVGRGLTDIGRHHQYLGLWFLPKARIIARVDHLLLSRCAGAGEKQGRCQYTYTNHLHQLYLTAK